jgi:hypothetical protein
MKLSNHFKLYQYYVGIMTPKRGVKLGNLKTNGL